MIIELFKKKRIQFQAEEYIAWRKGRYFLVAEKEIFDFVRGTKKECIEDVTLQDVRVYFELVIQSNHSQFLIQRSISIIRCMFRYFKARKCSCIDPKWITNLDILTEAQESGIMDSMKEERKKVGRPPHVENIKRVKFLKDKGGLSFRQISAILKRDVSQIHEWYRYPLDKLENMMAK